MKQLIFLFLSLILFSSCRKDFAYFQKSTNLSYSPKKNSPKSEILTNFTKLNLMVSADTFALDLDKNESFSPQSTEDIALNKYASWDDRKRQKKQSKINKKEGRFFQKIFPNQSHDDKKHTKKRRKAVPFNSTIYTGFIILGIAVLLALVSLNSLSLLFGVASIIFLYLGFRRYFRRKRRRDIFR